MTNNLDANEAKALAATEKPLWFVLTQVKSDRVVYFTNDPEYHPPMQGDWYYVSQVRGELPALMTLANCWRWRYRGLRFIDTHDTSAATGAQSLLSINQKTLLQLLHDKVETERQMVAPRSSAQAQVRCHKLAEAQRFMSTNNPHEGVNAHDFPWLTQTAAAHTMTLRDMAQKILRLHSAENETLLRTEGLRERFSIAIQQTQTHDQLERLREELQNTFPEQGAMVQAIQTSNTTPTLMQRQPTATELSLETKRLQLQLQNKINQLRHDHVSSYVLDEVVVKYKAQIAQAIIHANGAVPPGLDADVLISHAAARNQTLLQAAHQVLAEMNETAQLLLQTEQMKDVLLSRIAQVKSFDDIATASRNIKALSLQTTSRDTAS
jgi:hypothetical protein